MKLEHPKEYYFALARLYLKLAYSPNIARSFSLYGMDIKKTKRGLLVECFNGGAFVQVQFPIDGEIHSTGDYRKHRKVSQKPLMSLSRQMIQSKKYPSFYFLRQHIRHPNYQYEARMVQDEDLIFFMSAIYMDKEYVLTKIV